MRTLITTIAVVFSSIICVNAQDYYKKNKILSGKEVYEREKLPDGKWFILRNVKNKLFHEKMIIPNNNMEYCLSMIDFNDLTRKKIETILKETISAEDKEKMKTSRTLLLIEFFINDSGKVLELDFDLNKNNAFKPQYLSIIEQRIKNEIVFSFKSDQLKGSNYIRFNLVFNSMKIF
ncbi:MAG: hypothetical protein HXX14_07085 [Bacteroidetes bacterium]|nr:hypothetical protein [Bacteroidota bacterium]